MRRLVSVLGLAVFLTASSLIACNRSPSAPATSGTPPGSVVPVRVEISGPPSVAPGATAQFKAIMTMPNGTTRDVTTEAAWRSSSIDMTVTASGVVTGRRATEAMLTAMHSGIMGTREVIFVPQGTFRLRGVVNDPQPPSGPIAFAGIDVVSGTGRGLSTVSSDQGQFALYGVAGTIELRVRQDFYQTRLESVTVDAHTSRSIDLHRIANVPDVSGSYELTIAAADTCSAALPADAMVRKYTATLRQVGPRVSVTFSGATFGKIWDSRPANEIRDAGVHQNRVYLSFGSLGCNGYYYGCGPSILEQISPTRFFLPTGFASLPVTGNTLTGELDGEIEIHEGQKVPGVVRTASCRSTRHRITLTR